MVFWTPLLNRLLVLAVGLLYMPAVYAGATCNIPVETVLHGDSTPNIVKFDAGVTSLPFGADLKITVPTMLVNKSDTTTFACIRWKPTVSALTGNMTAIFRSYCTLGGFALAQTQCNKKCTDINQKT